MTVLSRPDLEAESADRVAALVAATARRRAAQNAIYATKRAARDVGLALRHERKLDRQTATTTEGT